MANVRIQTLTSVEYVDGAMEISKNEFDELDGMLRSIAWKYNGWYGYTFDDIHEILWEVAAENIKAGQRDLRWICRCCYNRVSDMMRGIKRSRARGFSCDDELMDALLARGIEGSYDIEDTFNDYGSPARWNPNFNEQYRTGEVHQGEVDVMELVNLFPKGSKYWKWMMLLGIRCGAIEVSQETFDKLFTCKHSPDYEISKLMEYNSQSNNGYRNIRRYVQRKVSEYLGERK